MIKASVFFIKNVSNPQVDDTSLTSTQRRGTNTSPPSVSSSSAVSSGPLLQISPSDFLIILPNETSHTMHIKNLHSTEVVFKVSCLGFSFIMFAKFE